VNKRAFTLILYLRGTIWRNWWFALKYCWNDQRTDVLEKRKEKKKNHYYSLYIM